MTEKKPVMNHFEGSQTAVKETPLGAVMAVMQRAKDFKHFTIEVTQV